VAEIKNFPNNADEYIGAEYVMKFLHGRTSGVFGADGNLSVSAGDGMQVKVSDGIGWLSNSDGDGSVFWNDTKKNSGTELALTVAVSDPVYERIDRVVVTWDTVDYAAKPVIEILKGSALASAAAPALTNNTLKRQISLAQIRVPAAVGKVTNANITDERLNPDVCGIVTANIKVDTAEMQAQFTELLKALKDEIDSLNAGTDTMIKTVYDKRGKNHDIFDFAGYLYEATYAQDGWLASGDAWVQAATLKPRNGGGNVTADSTVLSAPMCETDADAATRKARRKALGIINSGYCVLGNNTMTATVEKKPTTDITVIWRIGG
jgi:hypothetical protein